MSNIETQEPPYTMQVKAGFEHKREMQGAILPMIETVLLDKPAQKDQLMEFQVDYESSKVRSTFLGQQTTPEKGYRFKVIPTGHKGQFEDKAFKESLHDVLFNSLNDKPDHTIYFSEEVNDANQREMTISELNNSARDESHLIVATDGSIVRENKTPLIRKAFVDNAVAQQVIKQANVKPGCPIMVHKL